MSLVRYVKLVVPAGNAKPGPAIGQSLGPLGINMAEFCKQFNDKSVEIYKKDIPLRVKIHAMCKYCSSYDGVCNWLRNKYSIKCLRTCWVMSIASPPGQHYFIPHHSFAHLHFYFSYSPLTHFLPVVQFCFTHFQPTVRLPSISIHHPQHGSLNKIFPWKRAPIGPTSVRLRGTLPPKPSTKLPKLNKWTKRCNTCP